MASGQSYMFAHRERLDTIYDLRDNFLVSLAFELNLSSYVLIRFVRIIECFGDWVKSSNLWKLMKQKVGN